MPPGDQFTAKRTKWMKMARNWWADNAEMHPGQRAGKLAALALAVEFAQRILKTGAGHSRIVG